MAAAERVSEIVGPIALELGINGLGERLGYGAEQAKNILEDNDLETLRLSEAYAAGVNEYIESADSWDNSITGRVKMFKL